MDPQDTEIPKTISFEDPAALISEGVCHVPVRKERKVAVIGAGPSGLCAARHLFAEGSGFTGVVFEKGSAIGGTWVYTEEIGKDKYGQHINSPLYENLYTNLPKEVMEYSDFPYQVEDKSYLNADEVLDYLNKYATHFNLHPHIKLNHLVKRVAPVGTLWSLTAADLELGVEHVSLYDAIMVCSGPNSIPVYPQIEGLARFSGKQLHSKSFRRGDAFKDQRVLIIGLGPSGLDIAYKVLPYAKQVILSHNLPLLSGQVKIPAEVMLRPIALSMLDKTVTFSDGSTVAVDVVIHCTGYTYNYPFLTKDCGLVVNQYVSPLYLHLFNIENPTLCVLGLPRLTLFQYCIEYQARAFLAVLKGDAKLPSKEEMLQDLDHDEAERQKSGQRKKDFHKLSKRSQEYFVRLQKLANLPSIPNVRFKIYFDAFMRALKDSEDFRFTKYQIVNDEDFEVNFIERPERCSEVVQVNQQPDTNSEKEVTDIRRESLTDNIESSDKILINESISGVNVISEQQIDLSNDLETTGKTNIVESYQCPEQVENEKKSINDSVEPNELDMAGVSTIQMAFKSNDELKELLEKFGKNSVIEIEETSSTTVVEKLIHRRTVEETVIIDGEEKTVNSFHEEAVVENNVETVEKCEKVMDRDQQLTDGIITKSDENVFKHR